MLTILLKKNDENEIYSLFMLNIYEYEAHITFFQYTFKYDSLGNTYRLNLL